MRDIAAYAACVTQASSANAGKKTAEQRGGLLLRARLPQEARQVTMAGHRHHLL